MKEIGHLRRTYRTRLNYVNYGNSYGLVMQEASDAHSIGLTDDIEET